MPFMNQALPALSASSKGVLICGGGQKYIPSLWVCLNMLRHWGCSLPVEVWHLGGQEITPEQELWLREKGRCAWTQRSSATAIPAGPLTDTN